MNTNSISIRYLPSLLIFVVITILSGCDSQKSTRKKKNIDQHISGSSRNTEEDEELQENQQDYDDEENEDYDDEDDINEENNEEEEDDEDEDDDGDGDDGSDIKEEDQITGIAEEEEIEINRMDDLFHKRFNSKKNLSFPRKYLDLNSKYISFSKYLRKFSDSENESCPPVERCISIEGNPYYVMGKANSNPNDLTYKIDSKYKLKPFPKRESFTIKPKRTLGDSIKRNSLTLENDKQIKKEYELLTVMKNNENLKYHSTNCELLLLGKNDKNNLVLIKDYIDPQKFYTLNDFMASNKDSSAVALRTALGTLLDLLYKLSAEGIVVSKLDTFNMIIFHDKTGNISSKSKLRLTGGQLEEEGVETATALKKNLKNIKERWIYKNNVIKAQGIENCKIKAPPYAPKSSLDESTKGVLQDFYVTISMMLCDIDTFVDPNEGNRNAIELFNAQLDGTEPNYIRSNQESQEEEKEEEEEIEETPAKTTTENKEYTKKNRRSNGKGGKDIYEIEKIVDLLAKNQEEIKNNAKKIADQAQDRAKLERKRAELENEKYELLEELNQSIEDTDLAGSPKRFIRTSTKNITTEEVE